MTNLITDEQRAKLLANGRHSVDCDNFGPPHVVKLFTPDAGAIWLLTEIDLDDHDHAFGLCDLGQSFPELGYVSLAELQAVRGRLDLSVERDLRFRREQSPRSLATPTPRSLSADASRSAIPDPGA